MPRGNESEAARERRLATQKAYNERNKERCRAYHKAYYQVNKEKKQAAVNRYRAANRERIRAKVSEYNKKHRDRIRAVQRLAEYRRAFGLSNAEINAIMEQQEYRCAICRTPFSLVPRAEFDHCHKTNRHREFLCGDCNKFIGYAKESITILRGGIRYLQKHGADVTKMGRHQSTA